MRKPSSSKLVSRRTILATLIASEFHRQQPLIKRLLKRDVIVKTADYTIQGRLMYAVCLSQHKGLGNLVLEDGSIIRGSMIFAVCVEAQQP